MSETIFLVAFFDPFDSISAPKSGLNTGDSELLDLLTRFGIRRAKK
ncbi:hypothetical protein NIES2104_25200 [Leptolyngbya sp. NIES-2104]|nr:hypothetical protein NIES2104_25200 [Leptolyngbya sp. NIES-2104]